MINNLHVNKDNLDSEKIMIETLNSMSKYSEFHFEYEENLLEKHNYPKIKNHIELHKGFVLKILDFKRNLINNKDIRNETLFFLREWIINHINKDDKKYGKFLNKNII